MLTHRDTAAGLTLIWAFVAVYEKTPSAMASGGHCFECISLLLGRLYRVASHQRFCVGALESVEGCFCLFEFGVAVGRAHVWGRPGPACRSARPNILMCAGAQHHGGGAGGCGRGDAAERAAPAAGGRGVAGKAGAQHLPACLLVANGELQFGAPAEGPSVMGDQQFYCAEADEAFGRVARDASPAQSRHRRPQRLPAGQQLGRCGGAAAAAGPRAAPLALKRRSGGPKIRLCGCSL